MSKSFKDLVHTIIEELDTSDFDQAGMNFTDISDYMKSKKKKASEEDELSRDSNKDDK